MRIQLATSARHRAWPLSLSRTCLTLLLAATALSAGACSRKEPVPAESRLGAAPGDGNYQWNGNASRKGYGSNGLRAPGQSPPGQGGDTILFTSDSTDLTPEAKAMIDGYLAQIGQRQVRSVSIEGHADERGTREYNIALGARRAAAVKSYLLAKGLQEGQLKTISYGKERPVATCDDISCWARNRRAQLVVSDR